MSQSIKIYPAAIILMIVLFSLDYQTLKAQEADTQNIALIFDGPWYRNNEIIEIYRDEIQKLSGNEFNVQIQDQHILIGNWDYETTAQIIQQALTNSDIDLVVATGILSASFLGRLVTFPKPVISTFMLEPQFQNLPNIEGKTGISNFNYLSTPATAKRDIEQFLELVPFKNIGFLMGSPFLEYLPGVNQASQELARNYNIEITLIEVTDSESTLNRLSNIDAVYLGPAMHLSREEHKKLISGINKRNIPSFPTWES